MCVCVCVCACVRACVCVNIIYIYNISLKSLTENLCKFSIKLSVCRCSVSPPAEPAAKQRKARSDVVSLRGEP